MGRRRSKPRGPAALFLACCFARSFAAELPEPGAPAPLAPGMAVSPTGPQAAGAQPEEPAGDITLREALALALARNPELAAFSAEMRASDAAVLQAGVLRNPVLDVAAENLGNPRLRDGGERTTTIQFGQLIELGGKRDARIRLAQAGRDLAGWDYEAKRLEVLLRVSQYFVDVLAGQQAQQLAEQSLDLAAQVADAVGKRVRAGKVSPIEETKAGLALSSARVELEQARRQLAAARHRLAAMWGAAQPRFSSAAGDLDEARALPPYEQLAERARANPDLARWSSEIARRRAAVEAERAKAVPDVTLSAGVRRFSQLDDNALVLGLSVPLPLFDRNRGGILEAHRRLDKAFDEQRAAEYRAGVELAQIYQRLGAIQNEIGALRADILPGAASAYEGVRKGYELGKFGFLDVLDAQRTLFQARGQFVRALAEYHRGVSELERLIGGRLEQRKPQ